MLVNTEMFAPTFIIEIEGKRLSRDITHEITSFVYEDNEEELDLMEVTVTDRNLQFVDDPLFQEGNEIVARFGYAGDLSAKKVAVIKEIDYDFPEDGAPTITIKAYDKGVRCAGKQIQRVWQKPAPGILYSEIAEQIAGEQGLAPVVIPTVGRHLRVAQSNISDARFLRDLAKKARHRDGKGVALLAVPAALVTSTTATQRALGELASVGVRDFRAMEDAAESFTNRWSGSGKAEFISAAYDVKSALSNLSDEAVGAFSSMAALTAKATKASTQEMVGTFTTAYGIFKPIMADMSDMEWATAFSGAMAQTVASFKTTGAQMAEAIKNVGATAAASNIPLQEQLAILGQLQTTMPGSEAGTLYKAFVMKAAEAGETLSDMSMRDRSALRQEMLAVDAGIDTVVETDCISCGGPIRTRLEAEPAFLFPGLR